jgi:hypothetical protein
VAARYWINGTGTWSSTNTANWSATSGGAGGASVPTSADTPQFDTNSGTGTVTFTNGGVTVGATTINKSGITLSLGAAFTTSGALTLTVGTFTTNNYAVTATSIVSNNSLGIRVINLGSSTVTLSLNGQAINFNSTNLTFNAGTSSISLTGAGPDISVGSSGVTFYNVTFTGSAVSTPSTNLRQFQGGGSCTFNNLTITGASASGLISVDFSTNYTINGTLTLLAGVNATARIFLRSNILGTARTLTCAQVSSLTDIDFRDIIIVNYAAPISGTRLGDCKGNTGITFPAAKTVYSVGGGSAVNWSSTMWATSVAGASSTVNFPLAQDTAVVGTATPSAAGTLTINAFYNIGTVNMLSRSSATMTLANVNTPSIYGNWINGNAITLTGAGTFIFSGRNTQTITSAGKTFPQQIHIISPDGSVTLQDSLTCSNNTGTALSPRYGTFNANNYNVTLSGTSSILDLVYTINPRTVLMGSGTWTIAGAGGTVWNAFDALNLTVTGTGTINLTGASAKYFQGGDIQTYPTLNQGGAGTITVYGSNKFISLTNTAIGRIEFEGGKTNEFTGTVNIAGSSVTQLQLGSSFASQTTLKKSTPWNFRSTSVNGGNNTGLLFNQGTGFDYVTVSYVNGIVQAGAPTTSSTFFLMF